MIIENKQKDREFLDTPYLGVKYSWLSEKLDSAKAAILNLEENSSLPLHKHPGWEQIFVLEGLLDINGKQYEKNDFILIEANTEHCVKALKATKYITVSEKEGVEIIS